MRHILTLLIGLVAIVVNVTLITLAGYAVRLAFGYSTNELHPYVVDFLAGLAVGWSAVLIFVLIYAIIALRRELNEAAYEDDLPHHF